MERILNNEELSLLPDYIKKLILNTSGFEHLFLSWNPRFLEKHFIDYLPDYETDKKSKRYGKMKWRFVGWNNKSKWTGEELREMRKQRGVGNWRKLSDAQKKQ